ncbi:MAG TPA: DnaJ domain-containing protein [Tepidisphaeraceae bacterium]|jgi:DnaJ-class molecular chaperone|nr:DnaJ domain-containing protein [Tepidisphaeraceae bacterium]
MLPNSADDYYALLGVHDGVDEEELRKAWRELAGVWHPDRAGIDATAKFQQISMAYTVLSDPLARAAYDRRRRASGRANKSTPRATAAASTPHPAARKSAPAVMLSRLSGSLSTLLACGAARLDEPGFITLVLGEAEAAQGGMAMISMPVELWCPVCATADRSAACPRCGGSRVVQELFSAWLAVPPGAVGGETLTPSAELPGMVEPMRFRVRLRGKD